MLAPYRPLGWCCTLAAALIVICLFAQLCTAAEILIGKDHTAESKGLNIYVGQAEWDHPDEFYEDDNKFRALAKEAFYKMRAIQGDNLDNEPKSMTVLLVDEIAYFGSSIAGRGGEPVRRDFVYSLSEVVYDEDGQHLDGRASVVEVLQDCLSDATNRNENRRSKDHLYRCGEPVVLYLFYRWLGEKTPDSWVGIDTKFNDKRARITTWWRDGSRETSLQPCKTPKDRMVCMDLAAFVGLKDDKIIPESDQVNDQYTRPDRVSVEGLQCRQKMPWEPPAVPVAARLSRL